MTISGGQHQGATIRNDTLIVDYASYHRCIMEGCTVCWNGGPTVLIENNFQDCAFVVYGNEVTGQEFVEIMTTKGPGREQPGD